MAKKVTVLRAIIDFYSFGNEYEVTDLEAEVSRIAKIAGVEPKQVYISSMDKTKKGK